MYIGLFFGSFNPIHFGHLMIAQNILEKKLVKKIWFITSPQSPSKNKDSLVSIYHRMNMVRLAIAKKKNMFISTIELNMPQPNITAQTLLKLAKKYPNNTFRIILGEDNLMSLPSWENFTFILNNFAPIVYPRIHSIEYNRKQYSTITFLEKSLYIPISATIIRHYVHHGKNIGYFVPNCVEKYIKKNCLWKK